MRVLVVSDYCPTEVHGIALHVRNLVLELVETLSHEVLVFTCKSGKYMAEREKQAHLFVSAKLRDCYKCMGVCVTNIWNTGNRICVLPGWELFQAMEKWKPDVLHLFFPSAVAMAVLCRAKFLSIPTYCSHHVDMVYYVDSYMPNGCLRGVADYLYSANGRLPALLCGDANVAPSLAAMQKEFSFMDHAFFSSYGRPKLQPNDPREPVPGGGDDNGNGSSRSGRPANAETSDSVTCGSFVDAVFTSCLRSLAGNCIQKGMFRCWKGPYSQKQYSVIPTAVPSIFTDCASGAKAQTETHLPPPPELSKTSTSASERGGNTNNVRSGTGTTSATTSAATDTDSRALLVGTSAATSSHNRHPYASTQRARMSLRDSVAASKEKNILLMVNRLAPEKHVDVAIRVVSQFKDHFHLVICGDGPRRPALESLTADLTGVSKDDVEADTRRARERLGLVPEEAGSPHQFSSSNITFIRAVPNELLPTLFYRESDFFLTCSESETFGITVIEALGCDLLPILPLKSPVFAEFYEDVLGPGAGGLDMMFADEEDLKRILKRICSCAGSSSGITISAAEQVPSGPPLKSATTSCVAIGGGQVVSVAEIRDVRLRGKLFFSWAAAAEETVRQYEEVISRKKSGRLRSAGAVVG